FQLLWQAAAPDRQFELSLFRLWSEATHKKLLHAGVTDPQQIISVDAVEGLEPEELSGLRREVRFVIENRLPVPVAHRLAKSGVEDLGSIANEDASTINEIMASRAMIVETSDLAPLGPFLSSYFRGAK